MEEIKEIYTRWLQGFITAEEAMRLIESEVITTVSLTQGDE